MTTSKNHETFTTRAAAAIADRRLITAVQNATKRHDSGRQERMPELNDPLAVRELAARIKDHTLENLDTYLRQLVERVRANGGHVHFAETHDQARDLIRDIAVRANVKSIVKSKSMTTEEIHLTPFLEAAGLDTVETDLGEYIIQLDHDRPSHLIAPVAHKTKAQIADLFHRELGIPYTDDPKELTAVARTILRERFRTADMGIIGCNFAVAENGAVCIVTNEGNGRYCTNRPRVVVAVMGMEKVIPRMADLAVFLKLLPRSASGQRMTCYTNLITGPKQPGETDGPEEYHLVILDAGRTRILGSDYRETLRCIRCGACLNACPVYRKIGGHAYGAVYSGPIGALITPLFKGLSNYPDLPHASSLCGACYEACPVKIDIPRHLVRLRAEMVSRRITGWRERLVFRLWARTLRSPRLYRWTNWVQRKLTRLFAKRSAGRERRDRFADNTWLQRLPGPLRGWTRNRDMPTPTSANFRDWWKRRGKS